MPTVSNPGLICHTFTGNTAALSQVWVGDRVADAAAGETHTVSQVIVTTTDRNFVDVTVKADRGSSLVGKVGKALVGAAAAAALVTGAAAPASAAQMPAESGSTVTTTDTHPFYDVTKAAFVPAGRLAVGDRVQTTGGGTATITGLRDYHQAAVTYDLAIDGLHTYVQDPNWSDCLPTAAFIALGVTGVGGLGAHAAEAA